MLPDVLFLCWDFIRKFCSYKSGLELWQHKSYYVKDCHLMQCKESFLKFVTFTSYLRCCSNKQFIMATYSNVIAHIVYSVWRTGIRKLKNVGLLKSVMLSLVIKGMSMSTGDPHYASLQYVFPYVSGPYIWGTTCKNSPHFWGSHAWTTNFPTENSFSLICVYHLFPLSCSWYKPLHTFLNSQ
jgi:hypothetical protein